MQTVNDIKFAQKKEPEFPVFRPGNAPDTGSPAGFFNILKSQIGLPTEENGIHAEKSEPPKNAGYAPDKQYGAQETKIPEKEAGQVPAKNVAQAKPAVKEQKNDAHRTDASPVTGSLGEKKPAVEAHLGHKSSKSTSNEQTLKKPKSGHIDTEIIHNLLQNLDRFMESIRKVQENPTARHARITIKELHEFINSAKVNNEKNQLKKALEKAAMVLEKLYAQTPASATREYAGGLLAVIKDTLAKLKQGQDKNSNQKQSPPLEQLQAGLKEALSKPEPLAEGMKGEGFGPRQGHDGGSASALSGFGQAKNDLSIKIPNGTQTPSLKNSLFRDSLETIIQNARVSVRDAKNASFSIRLHPKELGSVNINLGLLDGVVHGRFLVDSPEAKSMLQSNLAHVIDEMRHAGISVGEFQVDVSGQRERLLHDTRDEKSAPVSSAPDNETISEFATHSVSYHEGYVNVLI